MSLRVRQFVSVCLVSVGIAPAFADTCTVSIANDDQLAASATFSSLAPGSTVCVAPGIYKRPFVISKARGTASKPLTFTVNPTGGVVELTRGLLLRDVAYVTVSDFVVRLDPKLGPISAVTLDVGTHHSSVSGLTVDGAFVGIALGSSEGAAGIGNDIHDNLVRGSWNTGIGVSPLSDGSDAEPNRIRANRVIGSGGHGIEVSDANTIVIESNTVSGNGTGINSVQQGGYSGIHLYASGRSSMVSPHQVRCSRNTVSANTVTGTLERPGNAACRDGSGTGRCADGNGIQIDQFCSNNTVASNQVSGNSGDGISIYGASGNAVHGNVVFGNNQQVDRVAFLPGPAEIAVSCVSPPAGSAANNKVYDNTVTTTVHRVPAFYLSPNAGENTIGPHNRWYWSPKAEPGLTWSPVVLGTRGYTSGEDLDKATGTSTNVVGTPP
jgi:parallel beta-helix repeat protein